MLSSVFLPSAFLGGITGQFFRQFALTIAASMIISAINAMTMTPARAASIFAGRKPGHHGDDGKEALPWWFFGLIGGAISLWLLKSMFAAKLGLPVEGDTEEVIRHTLLDTIRIYFIQAAVIHSRRHRWRHRRQDHHHAGELGAGKNLQRLQLGL